MSLTEISSRSHESWKKSIFSTIINCFPPRAYRQIRFDNNNNENSWILKSIFVTLTTLFFKSYHKQHQKTKLYLSRFTLMVFSGLFYKILVAVSVCCFLFCRVYNISAMPCIPCKKMPDIIVCLFINIILLVYFLSCFVLYFGLLTVTAHLRRKFCVGKVFIWSNSDPPENPGSPWCRRRSRGGYLGHWTT